jgi:hypothetical protein
MDTPMVEQLLQTSEGTKSPRNKTRAQEAKIATRDSPNGERRALEDCHARFTEWRKKGARHGCRPIKAVLNGVERLLETDFRKKKNHQI